MIYYNRIWQEIDEYNFYQWYMQHGRQQETKT